MELRGHRDGWHTMRVTERIHRKGGGRLVLRTDATLHFTDVGSYFGGSYWKVHQLARFELRRVGPQGNAGPVIRTSPKLNYCLRDLERTRPGKRSPHASTTPAATRTPTPTRSPRHLGRLVGHLPRRLRQAVDRRHRPARLLPLHDDRRPEATALRVERARQQLTPARPPPSPIAASRAAKSPPERPPSRRTAHSPSASKPVRSTTVEGRPVSSPPSIARSAAATIPAGTSANRDGAGSPLTLAEVWKSGHIAPASGPPIRRTPSRARSSRQASG